MRELIIGMDGFIGRHLCERLPDAMRTTRRVPARPNPPSIQPWRITHFDLLRPSALAAADVVYLCAGINGNLTCSLDPRTSYRVNVDGTIWVAEWCRNTGATLVWLSSTTVMWLNEHYGQQKRLAETYLRAMPHVAIVRAGRVMKDNVGELCDLMIEMSGRPGELVIWNADERPYEH